MTEKGPEGVYCLRNKLIKQVDEHLTCPYCFGRTREKVESGECKHFCDWDSEKDPVAFGFPPGTSRNEHG
jgi:hypothetical protein